MSRHLNRQTEPVALKEVITKHDSFGCHLILKTHTPTQLRHLGRKGGKKGPQPSRHRCHIENEIISVCVRVCGTRECVCMHLSMCVCLHVCEWASVCVRMWERLTLILSVSIQTPPWSWTDEQLCVECFETKTDPLFLSLNPSGID